PRSEAYFASPLALCARRVSSAASRLLGSTSLRFALHGWQRASWCWCGCTLCRVKRSRYRVCCLGASRPERIGSYGSF
ncbi:hypothetical protein, partial [Thiolapillus sp.]|uniref:hypothetical protein n=1 Tax=Thiolapillus sp. TaxID=2017437 RepID=UPI0025EF8A35